MQIILIIQAVIEVIRLIRSLRANNNHVAADHLAKALKQARTSGDFAELEAILKSLK